MSWQENGSECFRASEYQIVAERTANMSGTLVDVGARDKVLYQYIQGGGLRYLSSDIVPGHDFCWDLEKPLEVPDNSFEVVVALDVLERVERIHDAFYELIRIAKGKLFVSFPNMTCLSFRLRFFRYGQLSGKHALLPIPQSDRHRWLTSYPQVWEFVQHVAQTARCSVQRYDILQGYSRWQHLISYLPLSAALRTYTMLFEITKSAV
ncbi:MAG: methionine biosynthesis protein MetW [Candidatus Methanomethylicaceae archaeon]